MPAENIIVDHLSVFTQEELVEPSVFFGVSSNLLPDYSFSAGLFKDSNTN